MIVFYILVFIFIFKIFLNIITPYAFIIFFMRNKGKKIKQSLLPPIEIPLLLIILILSFIITEHLDVFTVKNIILWGGGAILFSYSHMIIFFVVAKLVVTIIEKIKSTKT